MPLITRLRNRHFAYLLALVLPLTMLAGAANARADITFRADYENGNCCVSGGWHDVQYEFDRPMADSFAIVSSPVRQGRYAAKVVVQQGYSPFGWNESTEAASGFSDQGEGTDYYYAWSTMFDASWHNPYGWGDVVQFYTNHYDKFGGPPPVSLDANGSSLTLSVLAGRFDEPGTSADGWRGYYTHPGTTTSSLIGYAFNRNYTILNTLSPGNWNDFVMHIHWSGTNGLLQIWHRLPGESWIELLSAQVPTLRYDPQTNVSDDIGLIKQGFYRQSYCQQPTVLAACNSTLGLQPPNILYQDAFVRGSSFDEVVAAAFGQSGGSTAPPSAPAVTPSPAASQSIQQVVTTGPDTPLLSNLSAATDPGCGECSVSTARGTGDADAKIAGGLDNVDTAYALSDFGGSAGWSGRVWTRDNVTLPSTALGGNLAILQQRDVSNNLVWELYVDGSTRQLSLWSPAGGLGASALNQSTSVVMDGQSHRIEVSALPNDSVVVRVDGQDRITLTGLAGSTSGNLRFLRVGIDHYDTGTSTEPISIGHSDAGVSTVGWLGTRLTALVPATSSAGGPGSSSSAAAPSSSSGGGTSTGGGSAGGSGAPATGATTKVTSAAKSTTTTTGNTAAKTVGKGQSTRASKPVVFVTQPRVAARRAMLVRLKTRPHSRLQIIVRDARGHNLGSTYAVSTRMGRSLQIVTLHGWHGQAKMNVIVRSHIAGVLSTTSTHIRLSQRELETCRGVH